MDWIQASAGAFYGVATPTPPMQWAFWALLSVVSAPLSLTQAWHEATAGRTNKRPAATYIVLLGSLCLAPLSLSVIAHGLALWGGVAAAANAAGWPLVPAPAAPAFVRHLLDLPQLDSGLVFTYTKWAVMLQLSGATWAWAFEGPSRRARNRDALSVLNRLERDSSEPSIAQKPKRSTMRYF